ncbi:MAG: PIN domain-containing protein [Proteobacteria bacterium]|nr:PIN domain-containing protein [Pseudomonadota bacterium]
MKVLVDTPIWSYALRSKNPKFSQQVNNLIELIKNNNVLIIGVIKQEILSGYSDSNKFTKLEYKMTSFENTPIFDADYIQAAKFSNKCRSKGVQGSPIDFLICAVAFRVGVSIFTTDKDFTFFQKHIPIELL